MSNLQRRVKIDQTYTQSIKNTIDFAGMNEHDQSKQTLNSAFNFHALSSDSLMKSEQDIFALIVRRWHSVPISLAL